MAGKLPVYIQDDVLKDIEQDTFGHKHIADAVVESILNTKPPFIIGIFGGWGTGKSSLLEIINSNLSKQKVVTVIIDAWRYSSAENIRRAFLVHVANKLAPNLLAELRRGLYTTEQETLPEKPSRIDAPKVPVWKYIKSILRTFCGLVSIFIGFLFIVFSIMTVIQNNGFANFFHNFDWMRFLDKFLDLAFIPFMLTLVNYLQVYVLQRPVTILHERIDADELFSDYFDKVVGVVTKNSLGKKKVVIFIDNLDRLTDKKMVEALESIKTYLHNDKCVFVITCDDNVVRNTINNSMAENNTNSIDSKEKDGEHYLDKFFQQTFRLPEYNGLNLHDFAERNFESTIF
jgi:Cdc6-like AAA superfamily ATPase